LTQSEDEAGEAGKVLAELRASLALKRRWLAAGWQGGDAGRALSDLHTKVDLKRRAPSTTEAAATEAAATAAAAEQIECVDLDDYRKPPCKICQRPLYAHGLCWRCTKKAEQVDAAGAANEAVAPALVTSVVSNAYATAPIVASNVPRCNAPLDKYRKPPCKICQRPYFIRGLCWRCTKKAEQVAAAGGVNEAVALAAARSVASQANAVAPAVASRIQRVCTTPSEPKPKDLKRLRAIDISSVDLTANDLELSNGQTPPKMSLLHGPWISRVRLHAKTCEPVYSIMARSAHL